MPDQWHEVEEKSDFFLKCEAVQSPMGHSSSSNGQAGRQVLMAYTVMAYTAMACIIMAYIVMAYVGRLSGRRVDMRKDMCTDMCTGMCIDMRIV